MWTAWYTNFSRHIAIESTPFMRKMSAPFALSSVSIQPCRRSRLRSPGGRAQARDGRVVLVLALGVEELARVEVRARANKNARADVVRARARAESPRGDARHRVHLERAREVESLDVEHLRDVGPTWSSAGSARTRAPQPPRRAREARLVLDEVALVEDEPVGERDLLDRLVLDALGLLLVEVLLDVLGVDQRDDAVEPRKLSCTLSSTKKVCATGAGSAMPVVSMMMPSSLACRRLDRAWRACEHDDEVLAHRAADAPVHHLDDLLRLVLLHVLLEQRVVDADLAEFILNDGHSSSCVARQSARRM